MELRELRTFVLVAQLKSFSKAGQVLFTTQPSISKMVSSLEAELGQSLFIREPHMLELTEFGQQFFPYAEEIIQAENNAMTFLSAQSAKPSIFLRIGISESIGTIPNGALALRVNRAIAAYHQKRPAVFSTIELASDWDLFSMVRSQKCDMAICPLTSDGDGTGAAKELCRLPLCGYPNDVIYSPRLGKGTDISALLQAAQGITSINDIASINLVSRLQENRENLIQHRMAHNWHHLLANVEANCAIGIIPDILMPLAEDLGLYGTALWDDAFHVELCLLYSERSKHTEYIREVSRLLQEAFSSLNETAAHGPRQETDL